MIPYFQGIAMGAGLIIAIGAQNSFVLSQGIRKEHNWLVAFICSASDGLLIFLGAAGVGTAVAANPALQTVAGWGGAVFLGYYGFRAFKAAMTADTLEASRTVHSSRRAVLLATLGVTLLNPHVYLDTLVLLGGTSGRFAGSGRYMFALGASSASLLWFFSLSLCGKLLAPFFQSRKAWRLLDGLVCLIMWGMAYQLAPITF